MKNQRKTLKRIFTLFVAILCTFGVFFVSYIDIFAYLSIVFQWSYSNTSFQSYPSFNVTEYSSRTVYISNSRSAWSGSWDYTLHYDSIIYFGVNFSFQSSTGSTRYATGLYINDIAISTDRNNPTVLSLTGTYNFVFTGTGSSTVFYFTLDSLVPTPTPDPATPTPAPATPTPGIDPGPALPTVPPGEQSYENFFARMAADAQNAFNALFASWQNANNGFYTSIFYIGIPVFIGIFGLVAYIVFGGDNDD